MHRLTAAAAGVLGFDAQELAQAVEETGPAPPADPRDAERLALEYYRRKTLPAGFEFFEWDGVTPAVVWHPAGGAVTTEEARIVPAPEWTKPRIPVEYAARCVRRLIESGADLWSDEILRLQTIAFDGGVARAEFALGRFYEYRFTTGLLGEEAAFGGQRIRDALMADVAGFDGRFTAGGVQVLVAFARGAPFHDFAIPLQIRGRRVSDSHGLHGVIPMAYHQPIWRGGKREASALPTALREFAEELFGLEERESVEFETHPAVEALRRAGVLEITGFSLNLVNGNYDYNILICHPDPQYWETHARHWRTNWEAEHAFILSSRDGGTFHRLVSQEAWVPQSLVTLYAGLARLRAIDPRRVG